MSSIIGQSGGTGTLHEAHLAHTANHPKLIKRKAGLLAVPIAAAATTATASEAAAEPRIEIDFTVGEVVEIVEGPFADFTGSIKEIDKEAEEVTVMVKIFGRETPVRLGFEGIEKL